MEEIHLKEGEVLGFLEPTDINSNDPTAETVCAPFSKWISYINTGNNPFK